MKIRSIQQTNPARLGYQEVDVEMEKLKFIYIVK